MARQYLYLNGEQIPLNGQDFWVGTHSEFENAEPPIPKGTLLYFTDGEESGNVKEYDFGNGMKLVKVGKVVTVDVASSPSWWFHSEQSIPTDFAPKNNLLYFPVWDVTNNAFKYITVASGKFNAQSFYYTLLSGTSWLTE